MRLSAPKYYGRFSCIADRCKHSCCVGWEIDVDGETLSKYRSLEGGYSEIIRESIEKYDTPHLRLREDGRCVHLDECGLCNIIKEYGEGYLSQICREHPRFYHGTCRGAEVGIGAACEEACRIILDSEDYSELLTVSEDFESDCQSNFDTLSCRAAIYGILSDRSRPYKERLSEITEKYRVNPADIPDERWQELLCSLEYLSPSHRKLFSGFSSVCRTDRFDLQLERILAYFIYRHVSPSESLCELSANLGLSLFLESLIASVAYLQGIVSPEDFLELCRTVSEELEYSEDNTEAILGEFLFL